MKLRHLPPVRTGRHTQGCAQDRRFTSAPGGVHSEGAGDTDCIVIYNIRGNGRDEMFDMLDETVQNVGKIGFEDFAGLYDAQKGAS